MITIELTYDEYFIIKDIFDRVEKQRKKLPKQKKWVKQNGLIVNTETGVAIDTATNRTVIPLSVEKLPDLIESEVNKSE